jgi:hypothetical protein
VRLASLRSGAADRHPTNMAKVPGASADIKRRSPSSLGSQDIGPSSAGSGPAVLSLHPPPSRGQHRRACQARPWGPRRGSGALPPATRLGAPAGPPRPGRAQRGGPLGTMRRTSVAGGTGPPGAAGRVPAGRLRTDAGHLSVVHRAVGAHRPAVASDVAGDGRDRPSLGGQCVDLHVVSLCEQGAGLLDAVAWTSSASVGPHPSGWTCRQVPAGLLTWGVSVIDPGDIPVITDPTTESGGSADASDSMACLGCCRESSGRPSWSRGS